MIEGRQRLIFVVVLDYEEVAEYATIDHDDAALDEEGGISLVWEGVT